MADAHTSDGQPRPNAPTGADQLKALIERAERVADEIEQAKEDFSELMKEAKSNGYDVPAIRRVLKLRNETADQKKKREERESIIDTYLSALGFLD